MSKKFFPLLYLILLLALPPLKAHATEVAQPTEEKMKMSFYVLEQNFSLMNRTPQDLRRNKSLLPLAESAVKAALTFYPSSVDYKLAVIRTLCIEGNFYLRTEKFMLSYSRLMQAKQLCQTCLEELEEINPLQACEGLVVIHPKLPALYSLVLHHLGQIPLYDAESPLNMELAEKYLLRALHIRQIIDLAPERYESIPDNNQEVGDAVVFKSILGLVYLQTERLDEAEQLYLDLLKIEHPFNLLMTHRRLLKIYQKKGQDSLNHAEKSVNYQKAMDSAQQCLKNIENSVGNFTRVSSIYKDIGNLYGDDQNPFQDIKKSNQILERALENCPDELKFTYRYVLEEQGLVLKKLSTKKLSEANHLRWMTSENENVESLKILDDLQQKIVNYEKLGDLYLEKSHFTFASAFYSNGLSLTSHISNPGLLQSHFYKKIAKIETQLLKNKCSDQVGLEPFLFENLIKGYKSSLGSLRTDTRAFLDKQTPVETIYSLIGERYKRLIATIIKDLIELLGEPPSQDFAFIAFGSIGRGFTTPYSDLEFAILLKEDKDKPYFQLLSELLHIRINALNEAPIALFEIESMNWIKEENGPSGRGLMLDPWNIVPHVAFANEIDLIGTPKHLAAIFDPSLNRLEVLKKCLFYTSTLLHGKEALLQEYQSEINQVLDHPAETRAQLAASLVEADLEYYHMRLGQWIALGDTYSLKYHLYRPFTTILDCLSLFKGAHPITPWQLIHDLHRDNFIDDQLHRDLLEALDEIGSARLNSFLTYGRQNHKLYPTKKELELSSNENKYFVDEDKLSAFMHVIIPFQKKVRALILGNSPTPCK